MTPDKSIWPTLVALEGCLCEEFAEEEMCFCGIQAGEEGLIEYIGQAGSMAWVRLDNSFPSVDFPNPDAVVGCGTSMAHVLEVGAAFCFPLSKTPPTKERYREAAEKQTTFQAATLRAITCCLNEADLQYVIGQWLPVGVGGGVLGGSWQVTVEQEWM